MKQIWRVFIIGLLLLTSCSNPGTPAETLTAEPTEAGLPTPVVQTTRLPAVDDTVTDFLGKWNSGDYAGMYAMLAPTSRDAISEADFIKIYTDTAASLTLKEIQYGILTTLVNPTSAKVGYQVVFKTSMFGDLIRKMEMSLIANENLWQIQWESGLIMPELSGGKKLALALTAPARGDIYDNDGDIIAADSEAVALGVVPDQIADDQIGNLAGVLNLVTGIPTNILADTIRTGGGFYVPIGEISKPVYENRYTALNSFSGLVINEYSARYYDNGGVAPQVIGYMLSISPEQFEEYKRNGYAGDEKVGAAGIEKWGESYLRGKPAADLYVVNPDGTYSTLVGKADPQAASAIYTTIDKDLQVLVQKALIGFTGAVVVEEVDTGRILAMASSPDFDPNNFLPQNYNSQFTLADLVNDEGKPLWNRAAQSAYPLGSVFKLVTATAALESGLYKPDTTYECTSQFTELPGFVGNDWTYDKELPPSGNLTLVEGIMRSCNPWFYHLGLDLYRQKGADYLSNWARLYGLGEATGIDAVLEETGQINDPTTEGAAVQMGIGQGDMLVTPLQVANMVAAIANGGTLYRPQVIQKITSIDGTEIDTFKPEVIREIPVSDSTLEAVRQGMEMVIRNERGTAFRRFLGMSTPVYGKTGTATTSVQDPHSWFAGFTAANNPEKPDISVAVILEYAGDGSAYAAPVFRRVIEAYFTGEVYTTYPWEWDIYITRTPTQETNETPEP
ncbi:MAG TPA: penicillin-binding transpeptidase domain-containing protein [Anaerolineaceae bacterium]|nr:penicillin-binding transpeptidase domain-containing protein [Anaerolineaceae bacterium]